MCGKTFTRIGVFGVSTKTVNVLWFVRKYFTKKKKAQSIYTFFFSCKSIHGMKISQKGDVLLRLQSHARSLTISQCSFRSKSRHGNRQRFYGRRPASVKPPFRWPVGSPATGIFMRFESIFGRTEEDELVHSHFRTCTV